MACCSKYKTYQEGTDWMTPITPHLHNFVQVKNTTNKNHKK